jgi:hypothetical protein
MPEWYTAIAPLFTLGRLNVDNLHKNNSSYLGIVFSRSGYQQQYEKDSAESAIVQVLL